MPPYQDAARSIVLSVCCISLHPKICCSRCSGTARTCGSSVLLHPQGAKSTHVQRHCDYHFLASSETCKLASLKQQRVMLSLAHFQAAYKE